MTDFLSLCCSKPVATVYGSEGTNHFVCTGCDKACDIRSDTQEKWVDELAELLYFDDAEEAFINNDSWHLPSDTDIHFSELIYFIRKTREEAKREVIQELKQDASDHLESSENLDICNFWIDVRDWLVLKQSDSLTSKEGEETV